MFGLCSIILDSTNVETVIKVVIKRNKEKSTLTHTMSFPCDKMSKIARSPIIRRTISILINFYLDSSQCGSKINWSKYRNISYKKKKTNYALQTHSLAATATWKFHNRKFHLESSVHEYVQLPSNSLIKPLASFRGRFTKTSFRQTSISIIKIMAKAFQEKHRRSGRRSSTS